MIRFILPLSLAIIGLLPLPVLGQSSAPSEIPYDATEAELAGAMTVEDYVRSRQGPYQPHQLDDDALDLIESASRVERLESLLMSAYFRVRGDGTIERGSTARLNVSRASAGERGSLLQDEAARESGAVNSGSDSAPTDRELQLQPQPQPQPEPETPERTGLVAASDLGHNVIIAFVDSRQHSDAEFVSVRLNDENLVSNSARGQATRFVRNNLAAGTHEFQATRWLWDDDADAWQHLNRNQQPPRLQFQVTNVSRVLVIEVRVSGQGSANPYQLRSYFLQWENVDDFEGLLDDA